jgi:phosphoadenosine phosphosulfate reductase
MSRMRGSPLLLNIGKFLSVEGKNYNLHGSKCYLDKVKDLLFIVSSNFQRGPGSLSFLKDVDLQKQQVRMLLEKTLNCVGCGVCLVLCPVQALYLDPLIKVDSSKCVGCLACCKRVDSKLKMGCIARNYKMSRDTIEF